MLYYQHYIIYHSGSNSVLTLLLVVFRWCYVVLAYTMEHMLSLLLPLILKNIILLYSFCILAPLIYFCFEATPGDAPVIPGSALLAMLM